MGRGTPTRLDSAGVPLGRDFTRARDVHAGPRDTSGVNFTDRRDLSFDPFVYFRIRHTFG